LGKHNKPLRFLETL